MLRLLFNSEFPLSNSCGAGAKSKLGFVPGNTCAKGSGRGGRPAPPMPTKSTWTINSKGSNCGIGSGGFQPGNKCAKGSSISPIPKFISSQKGNVETNIKAAKEMRTLAVKGDLAGLQAHPGTPSPKLKQYKNKLLSEVKSNTTESKVKLDTPKQQKVVSKSKQSKTQVVDTASIRKAVGKHTGMSDKDIKDAVTGPADPISNPVRMKARAKIESAILELGLHQENAVMSASSAGSAKRAKEITIGDKVKSAKEYSETPEYDMNCLSSITVSNKPIAGQAVCYLSKQSVEMGSTSVTGDYRHELGHALRASMGGGYGGKTKMTEAIAEEYKDLKNRVKADPPLSGVKLPYETYETKYGVIGRRGLDNWEEHAAEHYRGYHREVYRDRHEGGGGKNLAVYRERHPGWSKIWDAHYTAALLGEN